MAEARLFYESDCNLDVLSGKTVAIVGFGSQGHAHALNLHESGVNVIVGLYKGSKSWKKVVHIFDILIIGSMSKKAMPINRSHL